MSKTTLGKLLGANGLLFVLFSVVTYFTASAAAAAGLALIGLGMIAAYFATNYGQIGQFASRRSTFFIVSSIVAAAIALGALGAVNYVAAKKAKQWDLTAKKIFTLAPQTQSTLKGLKETVHAIGFLPADHPAHETVENLFRRYHDEAPDKFEYSFKDPRKAPDLAAKYQLKEGDTTVVLTRGQGDKESHTSLNAISEEELTNALIKLNGVGEQKVYFLAGHGEWPLEAAEAEQGTSLSELKRSLSQEGYAPASLNLAGKAEVPRDAAVVVIAGVHSPLTDPEVTALRSYLGEGGRMLYFAEAGREPGAAMNKLLAEYGVQVDSGIVADEQFTTGSPYMPVSVFYSDHELTSFLKKMQMNVQFPTARGFSVLHQGMLDGVHAEPVVLTSPYAWEETTPDENPKASPGEKTGSIPLVVAVTRPIPSSTANRRFEEARLVTFGDSELLVDANWGHEGNRNLVMNAFGWASNQVSKITIRPPDRDVSTLDIDKQMMSRIHLFTTNLLPLATLALGLSIWLKRRNQ